MRITQSRDLRQRKTDGVQEICGANSWFATNWLIGHYGKVMQDYFAGEVKIIAAASVVSQRFIENQPQILRLTTPRLKRTPGAPFAQRLSVLSR